jgi:phosphoribosylamine--glycine ligase
MPYTGFLYAGLMINEEGAPKVIEYNCRFGDPETQPVLARLESDLVTLLEASAAGGLAGVTPAWDSRATLCVVMAAGGYPGSYEKGHVIEGLDAAGAGARKDVVVFHAGTALRDDGQVVTAGGRVLGVTAFGDTIAAAQTAAYEGVRQITWPNVHYRTDIGNRAVKR